LHIEKNNKQIEEAMERSLEQFKSLSIEEENWRELVEEQIQQAEINRVEIIESVENQLGNVDFDLEFDSEDLAAHLEEAMAHVEEAFADFDVHIDSMVEDLDFEIEEREKNHLHALKKWLVEDLVRQGHIENIEEYDIELSKGKMIVNGKILSTKDYERYIKEISGMNRKEWKRKNKLILKKSKSMDKSKFKFDGSYNVEWEKI
jgi:hypothetical protein